MNRFLYAAANPTTLIDPTGHKFTRCDGPCGTINVDQIAVDTENARQAARQSHDEAAKTNKSGAFPQYGKPDNPVGDVMRGVWDSGSSMVINTVTGTYDLISCGGINAYNPITCGRFDHNVRMLTDPGYRNENLTATLHAYADGLGDAQANLTSGDPYRTTRPVTDVVLTSAAVLSLRAAVRTPKVGPKVAQLEVGGGVEVTSAVRFRSNTQHIFREGRGHVADTPENRALLAETVREENHAGTSGLGGDVTTYRRLLPDGRQVWVEVHEGEITNGGINDVPR